MKEHREIACRLLKLMEMTLKWDNCGLRRLAGALLNESKGGPGISWDVRKVCTSHSISIGVRSEASGDAMEQQAKRPRLPLLIPIVALPLEHDHKPEATQTAAMTSSTGNCVLRCNELQAPHNTISGSATSTNA
jgi:hypothetical protein